MRKPTTTPDAPSSSGTSSLRIVLSLALAASAGVMLWTGGGANGLTFASNASPTLETRVAALTSELAQVKAETAKLRDRQNDASGELFQIRASLTSAETGLATLRTSTDENEARSRDTADKLESELAVLKRLTVRLRSAQEDTATDLSGLRASAANSEIGIEQLRTTTGEMRQQMARIETAREATSSISRSHKHRVRRAVRTPEVQPEPQAFLVQWPGVLPAGRN